MIDYYDYLLIKEFKSCNTTLSQLKKIWGKRCEISENKVIIGDIVTYLLSLVQKLNLLDTEFSFISFVRNLNPDYNWKYSCTTKPYISIDTDDYDLIVLSRLDSLFALTEITKLDGYMYHDKKTDVPAL